MNKTEKNINGGNKRRTKKLKKMNCHPIVKGNTIKSTSCLTPKVLKDLRISYNKHHPGEPITQTESKKIWSELKKRMRHCSKEDCWLDTIKDINVKNKLYNSSFAPKHPEEWNSYPSTWLSNLDILDVLSQYEEAFSQFRFIGPTPIDFDSKPYLFSEQCVWKELCTFKLKDYVDKQITKIGVIFNLDKHDESGSHWTSMFVDLEEGIIFYFDSNGTSIPNEINKLVTRITEQGKKLPTPILFEYYDNHPFEHQKGNNECGMYSLYFIITMLTNKSGRRTFKNMKQKIEYFTKERIPDRHVFKHRKKYFNS